MRKLMIAAAMVALMSRCFAAITDFRSVRLNLAVPQYRNNFYPGQDVSRVAGRVSVANGVAQVRAMLASSAAEVTGEFLVQRSTGDLSPFPVNGLHGIEMKPLDGVGRVWGADVAVKTCAKAGQNAVYVKVSALGGDLKRPLFNHFSEAF